MSEEKKEVLKPLHNHIVFRFLEDFQIIENGTIKTSRFIKKTEWGLELGHGSDGRRDSDTAKWGQIVAMGPEVTDLEVGDYILLQPLMWTHACVYNEERLWRTKPREVLLTTKDYPLAHDELKDVVWIEDK
jgi:hypothetical protein